MECKKFAVLFAAMVLAIVAILTPTAFSARHDVSPFLVYPNAAANDAVANIRNPLASVFAAGKSSDNGCLPSGGFCMFDPMNCCGNCGCLYPLGLCFGSGC